MAVFAFIEGLSFRQLDEWVSATIDGNAVTVKAKVIPVMDLPYWTAASVGFVITEPTVFETIADAAWRGWSFVWKGLTYYWYQPARLPGKQLLFVHAKSPSFSTVSADLMGLPAYVDDDEAVAAGLEVGMPYWVKIGNDSHPQDVLKRVSDAAGYPASFTTIPFGLGQLPVYSSDSEAIAAGLAPGDPYWAGIGHETHPPDTVVRVGS